MSATAMTQQPTSDGSNYPSCSQCSSSCSSSSSSSSSSSDSSDNSNGYANTDSTTGPIVTGQIGSTVNGTSIFARNVLLNTGYMDYSSSKTERKVCFIVPLKSGKTLPFTWTRLDGQEALASAYVDTWMPAGAGSVFSFLPRVNQNDIPLGGQRVYSRDGTLSFDSLGNPQAQLPISATLGSTYFTTYDQLSGVYFEYFGGSLAPADARYGRVNRRFDSDGNVIQYNYKNNAGGQALLRSLTGDISGNLVPYFYYSNETIDQVSQFAPVTQISILDQLTPGNTRTAYFQYQAYTDGVTGDSFPYLHSAINPAGCTLLFDPIIPFNTIDDVYQVKHDVDPLGYETYFYYTGSALSQVAEPEGRIVYYEYVSVGETHQVALGRNKRFILYSLNSTGDQLTQVTQDTDPLGNTVYYGYDQTLSRILRRIDPNGNLTYYEYVSGGAAGQFAFARQVSATNGAQTYFGYNPKSYDRLLKVGPRWLPGTTIEVTYYTYDAFRDKTGMVDALGNTTLYGVDAQGRTIRTQDARKNTTYFNFDANSGALNSQVDALGNVSYFGYNSFRNRTAEVSSRWPEKNSFAAFTTYYAYDQLDRNIITIDPLGNVTYYDYNGRSDQLDTVDALGTETAYAYDGLRRKTRESVTSAAGKLLSASYYGYDIYKNLTKTQDALGRGTYFSYDQADRKTAILDALQNATYFGYDSMGKQTALMDARLNTTYYFYDQLSRNTVVKDPLANCTYYFYDLGNNRTSQVDALGRPVYFFYDALDRQQAARDSLGNPAYYFYDPVSNQTVQMDARFNSVYFGYDALNRQTQMQDALGNTTYYAYDAAGNRTRVVDARGNASSSFYDALNRPSVTLGALSDPTYFSYDAVGNRTQRIDARFNTIYFFYDGLRRITVVRDALADPTYYFYDLVGNRIAQTDARFNSTYFGYDSIHRQTQMQDALGNTTYYAYDQVGNRTRVTDPRLNTTYYFYDALNRQTVLRGTLGDATYFFYDPVGNRTVQMNARFFSTYFGYDAINRLVQVQNAQGNATYYTYDAVSNRTGMTDARQNTTYYFYDALNRQTVTRDMLGDATYFFYDAVANRVVQTDARFNSTYFGYDAINRLVQTQDALGNTIYYTYDAVGNQTATTDARGNVIINSYDALDRMTSAIDALGNAMLSQYDAVGNVTATVRGVDGYGVQAYGPSPYGGSAGVATYFFYDGLNRNTAVRDPLSNTTYFFYDVTSNQTAVLNPNLHTTYFGYDALNRRTRVQDALGNTTYFEFDAVNNPTRALDPDLHDILMRYDTLNRLDSIRFADTGSTYFFYDGVSNRTREVDPLGRATYYGYDALNRVTRMQDALGKTSYFEYDAVSNLSREVGAEGEAAVYTYDALNRRTNIAYTPAGSVVSASLSAAPSFVYDQVGNLTQRTDLWGLHLMAYDAGNRPVTRKFPNASVLYFEYDPWWNTTAVAYPGSSGRMLAVYDSDDRQTLLQAPSGATTYFSYDAASNQTQRFLGNGARLDMTYDAVERAQTWRNSDKNSAPLTYFDYSRDAKGLITKAVREANYATYFTYDANDRLLSEIWAKTGATPSEVYGFRYAYDLAGNRTKMRANGADTYYFYDQANQLTVKGTTSAFASPTYYVYDQNGSLTNLVDPTGATYFAYNTAGLVARIRWKDASATYFFYDGAVKRYGMNANGTMTYFLWSGLNLLQELNLDGTVKEEHTNAKTPVAGIAQLVETNRPAQPAGLQKIYPIMDMRGTITKWVQSDGATVLASREYDAFGSIIPNSAAGTWPGRFGYQGQAWFEITSGDGAQRFLLSPTRVYDPSMGRFTQRDSLVKYVLPRYHRDSETGLSLARSRFYHSSMGRWMHNDPEGYIGGTNLYEYVGGSPQIYTDPMGTQEAPNYSNEYPAVPDSQKTPDAIKKYNCGGLALRSYTWMKAQEVIDRMNKFCTEVDCAKECECGKLKCWFWIFNYIYKDPGEVPKKGDVATTDYHIVCGLSAGSPCSVKRVDAKSGPAPITPNVKPGDQKPPAREPSMDDQGKPTGKVTWRQVGEKCYCCPPDAGTKPLK